MTEPYTRVLVNKHFMLFYKILLPNIVTIFIVD